MKKPRVPPLKLSPTRAPPPNDPWETPEEVFLMYDGGWSFSFDPPTYKTRRYLAAKTRNLVHMVPAKTLEREVEALYHWKDRAEAAEAEKWRLREGLEAIRDELLVGECISDCPPEWPRCVVCRTHLRIQALLSEKKP